MGLLQILNSFIRLNNKPLDLSLTFDTLLEAKKYVAGLDTSKGTPYNGQIISVNSMCGTKNISATFKVVNNTTSISGFRLILMDMYSKTNGAYYHDFNPVIKTLLNKDGVERRHLLVYQHIPSLGKFGSKDEILMNNKPYCYSLLSLLGLFYKNNSNVIEGAVYYNDNNGDYIVSNFSQEHNVALQYEYKTFNGDGASIGGAIYLSNNRLVQDYNNYISYLQNQNVAAGETNGKTIPVANKYCIEIYVDIEDYLNRDGVI